MLPREKFFTKPCEGALRNGDSDAHRNRLLNTLELILPGRIQYKLRCLFFWRILKPGITKPASFYTETLV
jgi:hypothetical protein